MNFEFSGEVWYWRGPAPFFFVTVPEAEAAEIKRHERMISYGWGMIPVTASIGQTTWTTAMFPKNGRYILPLKDKVRKAEGIEEGHEIAVSISLGID